MVVETQWIDNPEQLRAFCDGFEGEAIAVDTESNHFHAYQARVCLIQVATETELALIDPLSLDATDLAPLFEIFEDPGPTKVLHAARNDIIELDRDYGIDVANLFDTQIAARFLDYERNSLSWMLEELIGVEGAGQFQRFDWTRRPLPDKVRRYAAEDVRHLLALKDRFGSELQQVGWDRAFEQQCAYVARSATFEPTEFDPEGWRKFKGVDKLDGRGRAALRSLYLWRHELCSRLNRAPVTLFKKSAMMHLARTRPTRASELADLRGVADLLIDEYADDIAATIERSLAEEIPPRSLPRERPKPPPPAEKALYDALRKWRNDTAGELAIPTSFVATNATLAEVAKDPPETVAQLGEFDAVLDWHLETFGDEILEIVRGS
ncbi:MAG: ribonuclease D [Persicimonas sp.]